MKRTKTQSISERNQWIHEFENLYILTYKSLYRHAKLIFGQEDKTKELLIQVYMEAYQRGEQLQKEKSPLDWLLKRSDFLAETRIEATKEMIEASYAEEKMQSKEAKKENLTNLDETSLLLEIEDRLGIVEGDGEHTEEPELSREKRIISLLLLAVAFVLAVAGIWKVKHQLDLLQAPFERTFQQPEKTEVKNHFPSDLASSETADLFMSVIMYRLKQNGRAAVILPDGFLFGTDNAKVAIKKKLMSEFNLHTVIRMPHSVFAPYTSITTNILFFDRTGSTKETWFYRLDMPDGYKNFSKTKPMKLEHFASAVEWWSDRQEITIDGFDKAKKYTVEELAERSYNIDLCGFPHEEEEILPPRELIQQYQEKRASLNADIDRILEQITGILGISDMEDLT